MMEMEGGGEVASEGGGGDFDFGFGRELRRRLVRLLLVGILVLMVVIGRIIR